MFQENNKFAELNSKFSKSKFGEKDDGYIVKQYKKGFKSYKDEDNHFTNFIFKQDSKRYHLINLIKYLKNNNKLDPDKFESRDIQIDNLHKITRVQNILNDSGLVELATGNITNVRKYKYLKDTGIQLYFYKDNNELNLIAVDVYHLIIPFHYNDRIKDYEKYKDKNYNIKRLWYIK